jgi:hypothetical protein
MIEVNRKKPMTLGPRRLCIDPKTLRSTKTKKAIVINNNNNKAILLRITTIRKST